MRAASRLRAFIPLVASIVQLAPVTAAGQAPAAKPVAFTMDFGFVSAEGNSRLTTFNLGEKLTFKYDHWQHAQAFGAIYGKTDGEESSNLTFATWRSDYGFAKRVAVYGSFGFERNKFAGISRRFEQGLGVSWSAVSSERQQWKLEGGANRAQQRALDGASADFTSVRGATSYRYNFSSAAYVFEIFEYLPNLEESSDYRINSETGVVAPLSRHLALKVGYTARFDNLPEPGRRRSDRIFTTGVQLNY